MTLLFKLFVVEFAMKGSNREASRKFGVYERWVPAITWASKNPISVSVHEGKLLSYTLRC
jgi:hypothetical protein